MKLLVALKRALIYLRVIHAPIIWRQLKVFFLVIYCYFYMSAKKRKSISPWSSCDYCNVIIAQKDAALHKEKFCPSDFQKWSHSFISHEKLYTILDVFKVDGKDMELIPRDERHDFVIIPCHVLQLCKIPIGDHVLVRIEGQERSTQLVKKAWPKQEKISDFSSALSNEVAALYDLEPQVQVIISKIQEKLHPADTVIVLCLSEICSSSKRNLLTKLQRQNVDKIYCAGNKVLLKHYGNKIVFEIVKIASSTETENSNDSFWLVTAETKWELGEVKGEEQKTRNLIERLGGLSSTISELRDVISLALGRENFVSGTLITRGVLIHGPPGTGKTTLMEALAQNFTSNVIRIEGTKIFSKFLGETEKELQTLFEKAKQMSPSIILIDDLDILCAKSNSTSELEKRIIATLSTQMDKLNSDPHTAVVVLGTTSKIHEIDKMLRTPNRFGKEVEIYVPGSQERFEILKLLLIDVVHSLNDVDIKSIASSSHGFVGADLVSLVSKAVLKNYKTSQGKSKISLEDFQWGLSKVKPSAMKEITIDIPNVRWSDIGGQEELKLKLRQCIEWPLKYREAFTKLGISPPKGVLMFGPPGCSKTMIAKALATESKLNFISVKGPELFSKWVGESERAVRKVFRRARQTAPSIIFFDELDAIGGERNASGGTNVQERVLAQLLTELDGVESLDNVTVIAATNRLDRIDPALIRPGRLDRIIHVPLPDSKTRQEIFQLQLKKTSVSKDVTLDELVEKSEGYSGAEIIAVCREAALKALEENLNADTVTRKNFMDAFNIVIPRTSKSLLDLYDKYLLK